MKCERIAELLPDYLRGNLNHEQDDQIEQHLEACAQCRADVAVWQELAHVPVEQPSPQLRARFEAMLHAYQEGQSEKGNVVAERPAGWNWWSGMHWLRPAVGFAVALVLFVAGYFAGSERRSGDSHAQEIAAVQSELTNMRQLLVLSMLQQQSASERLQGITWSAQVQADPQVLSALLRALRYDSSVGVRLAALDALSRHGNQPQVRAGLVKTLDAQQSPLVQVALIDLLVDWRDTSAVQKLQMVEQDPNQNPAVRQRAQLAIEKLNRGKL